MNVLFVLFAYQMGHAEAPAEWPPETTVKDMVKRINQRYDDFFEYRRDQEERWSKQNQAVGERKKLEAEHVRGMEKAREEYVKNRRASPSLEHLRVKFEAEEKERQAKAEMQRRRYVDRRNEIEQYIKKGRAIPELKEFDLEGY